MSLGPWTPPDSDEVVTSNNGWQPPTTDEVVTPKKKDESVSQKATGSDSGSGLDPSQSPPAYTVKVTETSSAPNIGAPVGQPKAPQALLDETISVARNAVERGKAIGATADVFNVNGGVIDENAMAAVAENQKTVQARPPSKEYEAVSNSKSIGEAIGIMTESPQAFVNVVTDLSLESLTAMVRHGLPRLGAGAATGMAAGSVIPGAGTLAGLGAGLIAGQGLTSLNLEISGKMIEVMQENGVDVTDKESIKLFFEDEEKVSAARELGIKRGIPVAVFDMISGGLAGKLVAKPAKSLLVKAGQLGTEMAVQGGLGAGGELAGQVVAGEELNPVAAGLEFFGETVYGVGEVAIGSAIRKQIKGENPQPDIAKAVASIPQGENKIELIGQQIDIMSGSGQITPQQAQALSEQTASAIQADAKIPVQVQGEKRAESLNALMDKSAIEEKIETLNQQKEITDPAFHMVIDDEISMLQEQADNKAAEIKSILQSQLTPKEDAVQESSTTEMDVRQPSENGGTVEQGNTQGEITQEVGKAAASEKDLTTLPKEEFVQSIADGTAQELLESRQIDQTEFMEAIDKYELPLPKFFLKQEGDNSTEEMGYRTEEEDEHLRQLIERAQKRSGIENLNLIDENNNILKSTTNEKETTQAEKLLEPTVPKTKQNETEPKSKPTNQRGKTETRIPEKDSAETSPKKATGVGRGRVKKSKRKLKGDYATAAALDATTPYDQTLQHFIAGGTIHSNVVQEIFGSGKKKVAEEKRRRIGITNSDTGAKTVDALAHFLWENQPNEGQFDVTEFREAVESVISSHNSTGTMVKEFLENNQIEQGKQEEYWRGQLTEQEREMVDDFNMAEAYWDSLTDEQKQQVAGDATSDEAIIEQILAEENQPSTLPSTPREQADALIAKGLEGILQKMGAIKSLTDEQRSTLYENVRDIVEGIVRKTGITLAEAVQMAIDYFKKESNLSDEDVQYVKDRFASPPPQKTKPKATLPEDGEKGERRFTKQVLEKAPKEFQEVITDEQRNYTKAPNTVSTKIASEYIDAIGETEAVSDVQKFDNGMNGAIRSVMAQILLKRFQARGEYEAALNLLDFLTKAATDAGQFIQAFSLYKYLTPEGQIRYAKRNIQKAKDERAKKDQKRISKTKQAVKKIAKESADEALENLGLQKKSADLENNPIVEPPSFGSKNKVFTKDRFNKALKDVKGIKFFSNPLDPRVIEIAGFYLEGGGRKFLDWSKRMIRTFGNRVIPHLEEIYGHLKTEHLKGVYTDFDSKQTILENINEILEEVHKRRIDSLDKAMKEKSEKGYQEVVGELLAMPDAGALWKQYRDFAVKRLKSLPARALVEATQDNPMLAEFTDGLVKNIRQQIQEKAPAKEAEKHAAKRDIEIIGDALNNFEKYKEVWSQTQKEIQEKYKESPKMLAEIDKYFGAVLEQPFSQTILTKSIKTGLQELQQSISDIARKHYTEYDAIKRTLTEKLVDEAGLTEENAKKLAKAISEEFDAIIEKKRKQILDRAARKELGVTKKSADILKNDMLNLLHLGAFSDNEFMARWAKANGYPELTPENMKEIERLAAIVAKAPDGSQKFRAMEDLLAYQAEIKGVSKWDMAMAVWYAHVLSGPLTHLVNIVSTGANAFFEFAVAGIKHPKNAKRLASHFFAGAHHGLLIGSDALRSGYNPNRGKLEVPATLEIISRMNKGKFAFSHYQKYVRRAMIAADAVFYEGLKEMRAYELAQKLAKEEYKLDPKIDTRNMALAIMNQSDFDMQRYQEQAQMEYEDNIAEIEQSNLPEDEKQKLKQQAERDSERRLFELIQQNRPQDIIEKSTRYAARGTFNHPPEGLLGALARGVNFMLSQPKAEGLRYFIPFTNIIANAANNALNYTPYGALRAAAKGSLIGKATSWLTNDTLGEELDSTERADVLTKALIGTTIMVTLAMLSNPDDEDDPPIEITANGFGGLQYQKNEELRHSGWRPYSFRVKNPKTGKYGPWLNYQYLTPIALVMSYVGNLNDARKYRKEKMDDSFWTKYAVAATYTIRTFFDMTFLSSMNTLLTGVMNPQDENATDNAVNSVIKTTKNFVVPNFYNQSFKAVQDITEMPNKEVKGNPEAEFLKNFPVIRDRYNNQLNALGDPVTPTMDKFWHHGDPVDPVWKMLVDKELYNLSLPSKKSLSTIDPEKKRKYEKEHRTRLYREEGEKKITDSRGKTVPASELESVLTDDEYYLFALERGKEIKNKLRADMQSKRALAELDADKLTQYQKDATENAMRIIYQNRIKNK